MSTGGQAADNKIQPALSSRKTQEIRRSASTKREATEGGGSSDARGSFQRVFGAQVCSSGGGAGYTHAPRVVERLSLHLHLCLQTTAQGGGRRAQGGTG